MFTEGFSGVFGTLQRAIGTGLLISGIISSSEAGLAAQSFLNAPMFGAEDGKKWLRSVLPDRNLSVKWLEAKLGWLMKPWNLCFSFLLVGSLPTMFWGRFFVNGLSKHRPWSLLRGCRCRGDFSESQELGCLRVSKHPGASRTLGEASGEILALFLAGVFFLLYNSCQLGGWDC